jgi:triosephosphate isomerase
MRTRMVVGNWKMHGGLAANASLLSSLRERLAGLSCRVGVCVPFPYLAQAGEALRGSVIAWGAQDLSEHSQGAYTGEVSAGMVAEFGATLAIVGHSERRALHGEADATVAAKAAAASGAGLQPIVCVGETLEQREGGRTEAVVGAQLDACIARLGAGALAEGIIAYEPVWAIGTGRTATPQQAQAVHAFIRGRLGPSGAQATVLYGGSVKPANARELFAMPDIDGGLIGGASLAIEDFEPICRAFD